MYVIGPICWSALRSLLGTRGARRLVVLAAWYESAGSYAPYVEPIGLEGETLVLATSTQALAHELTLRRGELVRLVNARVGDGGTGITDVRVVVRPPQDLARSAGQLSGHWGRSR